MIIIEIKVFVSSIVNIIKPFSYLFLWPHIKITPLVRHALQKEHGYDLLISIAVPYTTHWGVALAMKKKKNNIAYTWIADCGDPFIGNKEKQIPFPFYFRWIENWFCKKPDYITVPVKEAVDAYPQACRSKIQIIPQGFDFSNLPVIPKRKTKLCPVFAYAGKFNDKRDPRQFLDYLVERDDKFVFVVYTKSGKYLEGYAEKLGNKLLVKDYIPREQLLFELSAVDFVINFENTGGVQVPSKLIDYALIKKPVLSLKAHEINKKLINEFLNGDYSHRKEIGDVSQYDIRTIANKFLDLAEKKN